MTNFKMVLITGGTSLGKYGRWVIGVTIDFLSGYTLSWLKVLRTVVLLYALTCIALIGCWQLGGDHAIVRADSQGIIGKDTALDITSDSSSVKWYHYPYFTLVTFATLGYGDFSPNLNHQFGMLPAYISSVSSAFGIIAFGFFLATLIRRLGAHDVIRAYEWFNDYEIYYSLPPHQMYRPVFRD